MGVATLPEPPALLKPELASVNIFAFYRPLALSWIFMAIESPICVAILSRLAAAETSIAALFIMGSISLWIESPVIDLLATSTTLTKDHKSYVTISKFAWIVMGLVTFVHGIVAFTPIFEHVTLHYMSLEPAVAKAAGLGMKIMTPWSALIGWRRYRQGILIRYGRTRSVGRGTFVRMSILTISGILLALFSPLPGIAVAACALVLSVGAEALYAHWSSAQAIRQNLSENHGNGGVTLRQLAGFHIPLTLTTMLTLVSNPLVANALAKADNSTAALASWQISMTLLWLMRTTVYALPEVVISLAKSREMEQRLLWFSLRVGYAATGTLLLLGLTGLDRLFFRYILHSDVKLLDLAHTAFLWGSLLPLIGAGQCYLRGILTLRHQTPARLWAITAGTAALGGGLFVLASRGMSSVATAAATVTAAMALELVVLIWFWRKSQQIQDRLSPVVTSSDVP